MNTISANELKTKGISALEAELQKYPEAIITVRGKNRFVVMSMEHYNLLRECELEAAILQAQEDLREGRFITETVEEHVRRITHDDV